MYMVRDRGETFLVLASIGLPTAPIKRAYEFSGAAILRRPGEEEIVAVQMESADPVDEQNFEAR
jgi:hypothetical protein